MPFDSSLISILPSYTLSEGATISPLGNQDFTTEVKYTVTAENGSTYKNWYVRTTKESAPLNNETEILSFDL